MKYQSGHQPTNEGAALATTWELDELVVPEAPVVPLGRRWMLAVLICGGILCAGLGGAVLDPGSGSAGGQDAPMATPSGVASPAPATPSPRPAATAAATSQAVVVSAQVDRAPALVRAAIVVGGVEIAVVEQPVLRPGPLVVEVPVALPPFAIGAEVIVELREDGAEPRLLLRESVVLQARSPAGLLGLDLRRTAAGPELVAEALVPASARSVTIAVLDENGETLGQVTATPGSAATWGGLLLGVARVREAVPVPALRPGSRVVLEIQWVEDGAHHELRRMLVVPGPLAGGG